MVEATPNLTSEQDRSLSEMVLIVLNEFKDSSFASFYHSILTAAVSQWENYSPIQRIATITLNLKLCAKEEVPWLFLESDQESPLKDEQVWNNLRRFVYASEFNQERDLVRDTLERKMPQYAEKGYWEHLEIFVSDEIVKKNPGETRKQANARVFCSDEGPVPEREDIQNAFIDLINAPNEYYALKAVAKLDKGNLFILEQLCSSIKQEDIEAVKQAKAKWFSGYKGKFTDRDKKIRILRLVRHGKTDIKETIQQLNTPSNRLTEIQRELGRVLRQYFQLLKTLLSDKPETTFSNLIAWLETNKEIPQEAREKSIKYLSSLNIK